MIPKRAIILAGGFGTRLRSVVSDVPKPMAPIQDRPFLAYLIDSVQEHVTEIVLAIGYKGEVIKDYFGDEYKGIKIYYSEEKEPLGTGGAITKALALFDDHKPVWVLNGDTFFSCDLSKVAARHNKVNADITLALCYIENADRYGLVQINEESRITSFLEKKPGVSGTINAGVYLINPMSLRSISTPKSFSFEKEFLEKYTSDLFISAAVVDGYFVDIGIPEDYKKAQRYFCK